VITNLTRSAFAHAGFTETDDARLWNASWGCQFSLDEYRACQAWQKINHWAGAFLMGRKDDFHQRMAELRARAPDLASFYPESFLLPDESPAFAKRFHDIPLWILKPAASSGGEGIRIVSSAAGDAPSAPGIAQVYIANPFLITGRKFDVRLYFLVPSTRPLRLYVHRHGLVRFCTHAYDAGGPLDDFCMHLTNFRVNEADDLFVFSREESVASSKWSLAFWLRHMASAGADAAALMCGLERAATAALIAGLCAVRRAHAHAVGHRHASYEVYGVDLLLDAALRPYVTEVNISPSTRGAPGTLDWALKFPLVLDALRMARIVECDAAAPDPCPAIARIDDAYCRSLTTGRVRAVEDGGEDPWERPVFADVVIVRDFVEEAAIASGFALAYPGPDDLAQCFDRMAYEDIVLQRWLRMAAEERAAALQRGWRRYARRMQKVADAL
jgi:tubulin polyglutamylase TTLL4